MSLLEKREYYQPFHYPWAFDMYQKQLKMHWIPDEVPMQNDITDWKHNLTVEEKNLLMQIFRFFTTADIDVAKGYCKYYLPYLSGAPEVAQMLTTFASFEAIHVHAYSLLLSTLGIAEDEFKAFTEYKEMMEKHEYMSDMKMDTVEDMLRTIAVYSAFGEGMQLFSSFAILMNFPRHGKMKGMGQIVTWSIKDESCFKGDTEILTSKGWIRFDQLEKYHQVAQYNKDTKEISFITPTAYIHKEYDGDMITLKDSRLSLTATADHELPFVYGSGHTGEAIHRTTFAEFTPHYRHKLLRAGYKNGATKLTAKEQFQIALQADGSLDYRITEYGKNTGYKKAKFYLTKSRKIERLKSILEELKWPYAIEEVKGRKGVLIKVECDLDVEKTLKWVDLASVTSQWGREFITELMHWDGHDVKGDGSVVYYSSVDKENVDVAQAVAALSGFSTTYSVQKDDRKESYRDVHRLWFYTIETKPTGQFDKVTQPYNGFVYCVTVPDGNIVVRQGNEVFIVGNCHTEGMIRLFRTLALENPSAWTDEVRGSIYEACRRMVELEDKFIDLAFAQGGVIGLDKSEVKEYIRYIADRRLLQLGLKTNYKVKENPLPWLEEMLNSQEHANFFETRVTEYQKASVKGDWSKVWNVS